MKERLWRLWLLMFIPVGIVIYFVGGLVWGLPYWIWTGNDDVPIPKWFRRCMGEE